MDKHACNETRRRSDFLQRILSPRILYGFVRRILSIRLAIGAEKKDRDKYGPGRVAARSPKLFVAAPPSLLASRSVSVAWRTSGPPPSPPSSQSRSFDLLVSSRNEGRRQAGQRRDRARRRADGERRQRVLRPAARLI
ncbi:hypothetical protein WN48_04867 [Eufriesea mexicana]|uniref:Uncharacterized protein n=1 Tax=Eufriesea mexicana TaxID=516756 RepID=A0A310S9S6_9HYME|nr:hypothetical protein WN48_04867 [Eufriesea mexicana]